MTKLTTEIQKSWEVFKNNLINMVVIISLLFIIGQADVLIHNLFISKFLKLIKMVFNIFLSLIVVHIVIKYDRSEKVDMKEIIKKTFSESKEVFIILCLNFIFLMFSIFALIPIVSTLIIQALFIFVWPIFIVEGKRRMETLIASTKLVYRNIRDLFKYLAVYSTIAIVISIISIAEGLDMTLVERIYLIGIKIFGKFVAILFTILVTKLYIQYKGKNDKQTDFI